MDLELIEQCIENPAIEKIEKLLDDENTVFWVDWREEDDRIAGYCEDIIHSGSLSGKLVELDVDPGYEICLEYKDNSLKVPIIVDSGDRHITLVSLNEILDPDYEIRFCVDSHGSDSAAFLPLPRQAWQEFENRYGQALESRFYRLKMKPNLFVDTVNFETIWMRSETASSMKGWQRLLSQFIRKK